MSYHLLQSTFNSGELSPLLGRRNDIDFWGKSVSLAQNLEVMIFGGLRRPSGTRFIAEVSDSSYKTRLFPFIFSASQSYVVAMNGDGSIRFHAVRGTVEDGGSPYEVSHSYDEDDMATISFAQFNDTMEFAHRSYSPSTLKRMGETDWTLEEREFRDGPYLPLRISNTTLLPAGTGSATPFMTSATAPSGTVGSTGPNIGAAWNVFDGSNATYAQFTTNPAWISYEFGGAATKIVDAYWLRAAPSSLSSTRSPETFRFQGYDGANWITLDSRAGETGWASGEVRFYDFTNETAYEQYRLLMEGNADNIFQLSEIGMHLRGEDQTAVLLVASSAENINGGQGFLSSDVGRSVRLQGSDGSWRWASITSFSSSTQVYIKIYGHSLPDLERITRWQMGALSDSSGWPGCVALYNERIMYARTNDQPLGVYGSKQGEFDEFGLSQPVVETDGISITLLSSNMSEILWIADDIDMIAGSAGQIRSIGPADLTAPFSATNITQRKGPTTGAEHIRPLDVGGTIIYVGRGGTRINELVATDGNRYAAPELSILSEHIFRQQIVDWSFRASPEPQIICVLGDGTLGIVTYSRDQKVVAVSRRDVGGIIESIAVIPSETAGLDDVYLVVNRTIDGSTKRYIEVMEHAFDWDVDAVVDDGYFVDCGLTYSGTAATVMTGLDHLEGEDVIALADGSVVRGLTVSGGSVTLPFAVTKAHIGLAFKSKGVLHPIVGQQQDGSLLGRRVTPLDVKIDVYRSGAVLVGAYAENGSWVPPLTQALASDGGLMFGNKVPLKTGTYPVEIEGSWADCNGQVTFETDEPLPLLVRAIVVNVESEP